MNRAIILFLGLFLGYVTYFNFPQQFEVGQCFTEEKTGELYRALTKSERDLSFKDHWVFGPMKIESELVQANPNTLRKAGDHRIFYPSSDSLLSSKCEQ